jgi:hypothetical protein
MAGKIGSKREIELEIGKASLLANIDNIGSGLGRDYFTNSREIVLFRYPSRKRL